MQRSIDKDEKSGSVRKKSRLHGHERMFSVDSIKTHDQVTQEYLPLPGFFTVMAELIPKCREEMTHGIHQRTGLIATVAMVITLL